MSVPDRINLLKHDVLRGHPRKTYAREDCEVQCIYAQIILFVSDILTAV
jgi:hypothetical protein